MKTQHIKKLLIALLILSISACVPASNGATVDATTAASTTDTGTASSAPTVASPEPTLIPGSNEYVTVAQLNLWFNGAGCNGGFEAFNCSGQRNTPLTPALGRVYNSAFPAVIQQQIDWAADYGVDAFSIEWTTPRYIQGSLEANLDDSFLKAPNLHRIRWCIFYDLVLRLDQTPKLHPDLSHGMNFDDPDVYNTFVADIEHFAKKYFDEPEYLKIDGRPVVYVWGTWNATGNFVGAFEEARKKAADAGYDVYLVGDIIRTDHFNPDLASVYDANTNFVMFVPGSPLAGNMGEATPILEQVFTKWETNISGLKVRGRDENVILQPGFAPQYDDRLFRQVNSMDSPKYVPAENKQQVVDMATMVRDHAQAAGSEGLKLVWLNTWNNWPETTTFEPTADTGPKYPAGNYQFDFVEIIRDVFGPKTFSN